MHSSDDAMAWLRSAHADYVLHPRRRRLFIKRLDALLEPLGPEQRAEMIVALALGTARGFLAREFDYQFGDRMANKLWRWFMLGLPDELIRTTDHISQVYIAFDAGERPRPPGEDPVEMFTRPMLTELLAAIETP